MISNGQSLENEAFHVEQSSLSNELASEPDALDYQPSEQDIILNQTPEQEQVLPEKHIEPLTSKPTKRVDLSGRGGGTYDATNPRIPYVDPNGSLTKALFMDTTSIGALMTNRVDRDINSQKVLDFNFFEYIKDDMLPYASKFALASSEQDVLEIEAQVRSELANDALIAAHPGKSLLLSIPVQLTDPVNLLPLGRVWNSFKSASTVTRAALGASTSGVGASLIQESLLQNAQLTRETQESVWNVLSAGIISGALGAGGAGLGKYRMTREQNEKAVREVNSVLMGERPSVGAMGVVEDHELANFPDAAKKALRFTQRNRLQTSQFKTSQKTAHEIFETNLYQTKNERGVASDVAVETIMIDFKKNYQSALHEAQQVYYNSLGLKDSLFQETRAKFKKPEMSYQQADQAASYVITSAKPSGNKTVDEMARIVVEKAYKPWAEKLVAAGRLEEGTTPENAAAWFHQSWNQQLIIEQGGPRARGPGTAPEALFEDFKQTQNGIKALKESPAYKDFERQIKEIRILSKKTKKKKEKNAYKKKIQELESMQLDLAPAKFKTTDIKKLRALVDDDMLWNQVDDAVDNILSQADGTLINPAFTLVKSMTPDSLKTRAILADQLSMRPWHNTSMNDVTEKIGRALAPILAFDELAKNKGFKNFDEWRLDRENSLKNEYHAAIAEKTGKEADKITKAFEADLKDINDSIKLIEGVYGAGANTLDDSLARTMSYVRQWNVLRLMGGVVIASFNDVGGQVLRNGAFQSIYHGIVPMLQSATRGKSKRDLQAMHHVMESALGLRFKSFADSESLVTYPSPWQKGFNSLMNNFGNISFINQWNDFQQLWAGTTSIHRTLSTIADFMEGKKVAQKDITRVAHLGISQQDFAYIYSQTKDMIAPNGTRTSDWTNWTVDTPEQARAQRNFVNATSKDIRSIVIEPGLGDLPTRAHTKEGKTILQFKTFSIAATTKITASAFQRRRDAEVWQGVISMLTFATASYVTSQILRGKEPDYSFENLAHEAIDRSGLLGILTEFVDVGQKLNLLPGESVSRYQSRGAVGALFGPTYGAILETLEAVSATAGLAKDKDLSARDIQAYFRLLPFQNLFYMQYLTRIAVGKVAETFDLEDNR